MALHLGGLQGSPSIYAIMEKESMSAITEHPSIFVYDLAILQAGPSFQEMDK